MLKNWTFGLALSLTAAGSVVAAGAAMSVKVEMKQVVEPASNTLFAVGGAADPENGPEAPKPTDAQWRDAATAANTLATVATGLNTKAHAKPGADWAKWAHEMQVLSAQAAKAAAAHDGKGLAAAANNVSDNCAACHAKYKPQTGD